MNRTVLAIGVLVLATIGLVALFVFNNGPASEEVTQQTEPETPADISASEPIGSIREAMSLGRAMRCTYTAPGEQGSMSATAVVEGERYAAEIQFGDTKTRALYDGQTQYVWTEGAATGFKIEKACLEDLKQSVPENAPAAPQVEDPSEDFDAAENVSCTPERQADFRVPENITFTDQCAFLRQNMDTLQQLPAGTPQGAPALQ